MHSPADHFARLTAKYGLPVYPIVVFSYDAPLRPEPDTFVVQFPGKDVLRFEYAVIQLNRLPWRKFVRRENPVASALMAKMKMEPSERPRVKLECLRLLVNLQLDPARMKLISGFVDSYLRLNAQEEAEYARELAQLEPKEREATMEVLTSWEERGMERGLIQGKEAVVMRQLRRRLGQMTDEEAARVEQLSSEQLDDLADALLDFGTTADLQQWLARQRLA